MRKVRYKRFRVDMGGVWVSLLLLLYLAPGAPGLGDHNRPVTLHQLSLVGGHPQANAPIGVSSPLPETWRMRRSRVGGVRRSRRRTQSHYREDPEPEDYEDEEDGSANQVDGEEEEEAPEEDPLLLEQHVQVEEDDDDEAPPDSTEIRERYRVSDHENPPEPSTKPNYTAEGQWAKPPAHVAQRMPFVPVQNYAQVRRYETELHLSPEDALSEAANEEEAKNAPRLREVVTHHKTLQVYSEEGYEDSAYDHGGYDKHGEHHELAPGWEKTAVRLLGRAAEPPPEGGSGEEEGGEGDEEEEDGDDHNAEGSDPRAKAVVAPAANGTRHGATNEARGTWRFQKVTTDNGNQVRVAEASGNFSRPTPITPWASLVTSAKSKRESAGNPNSTIRPMTPEQLHLKSLVRALKLKEKERRLAQKRSKKWGREKKKNRLTTKLKKERPSTPGEFDIRDNEIKQPKSSKVKKLRKEQKRAKRMKASKTKPKRKKALGRMHVYPSTMRAITVSSGVHDGKDIAERLQIKTVADKSNTGLVGQVVDVESQLAHPLGSVMKNPFSMYHRNPSEAVAGLGKDRVLGQTSVGDEAHSKIWGLSPPWGSYGKDRQSNPLQTANLLRPLSSGLLASVDSEEVVSNEGLATVIQPVRSNMEGFLDHTGRMGAWNNERSEEETIESSSSNESPRAKFVLPGRGNTERKFPKTEAILQMETRTLSKLRKTHNVKELPSNLKHVKPLIGVSSGKNHKLTAKQIKMKDIGKRPHFLMGKDFTGTKRDTAIPTKESLTEKNHVAADRAVYIANLTENYLSAKNFSWPPQVTLPPLTETKQLLDMPYVNNKAERLPFGKTSHKKTRRNARYHLQEKPSKVNRGSIKYKRDKSSERLLGLGIDEEKYPFYLDKSTEDLAKFSPLRYAINPSEIPVKTGGGMEFYESREKFKRCKEVEPPEDPVPDRPSDGQWVQNNDGPDGPRISGLGEVINCLREKLFGSDPLDNPFFLETKVGLPADTSLAEATVNARGTPVVKSTDHLDFYQDLMKQLDNTALKPLQSDVPDNPYVYMGSTPTSGSEEEEEETSPTHHAAPRFHHSKKPEPEYYTEMRLKAKEMLAAQLAPRDVADYDEEHKWPESLRKPHIKGLTRREPPVHQQYFDTPVPQQYSTVDPHKPQKYFESSKKYMDDFIDDLANQKESKDELLGGRSQTDAQETNMRITHSDSIYEPAKALQMHPPAFTAFKYKSKYTDNLYPGMRLGPNSPERLLSWPKAKNVLRDVGAKQEVFETSETKDPIRSQSEADPGAKTHEQKQTSSGQSIVHSASFNFNQTQFDEKDELFPHPSKTAEIVKQIEDAIKQNQPNFEGTHGFPPTKKPEEESKQDIHAPAASVITPLSTSHPSRLPEPIYHAVRGVGGIKAYHVGMQDDSVIEIPTPKPGEWRYKPKEHSKGADLSAQQSDEGEPQASNEPEQQEEAPGDDNPDENQEGDDKHDDDNASANKNEDDPDDNKNDDDAGDDKGDDDKGDDAGDDKGDNAGDDKGDNEGDGKTDDDASDGNKNDDNASDANKNDDKGDDDKQAEDDEAKPEEAPENEEEDDKSNNNGKPDFDDWFKESPYKVNDENDYNLDWDDSRAKSRVPFSKEWHKELGGINDEFKDDKDEDEVGKHVEKLFDDDKGHDAYPDINTEPPAPASGEGDQKDGNEGEKQEASEQEPQEEAAAPSEEGEAASPEKEEKKEDATEEANDTKKDPKEEEDGSNAAEENVSPEEDNRKAKQQESAEPTSQEEPTSAEEPKQWESSRHGKKKPEEESAQDAPSLESGGTGNNDGYDPAAYEKPGDEHNPSAEAHSTDESKQSPKRTKVEDEFWTDKDDFGAPPGAKIRVVEHDASFGDMDDDDDDDLSSNGGKKVTRRGKTPDNLSITTTNSQVRSKGFDTGINKRRATSHQKKARPVIEQIDGTSSGEDMDGDFATNLKVQYPPPEHGNTTVARSSNVTNVQKTTAVK